jgi:hypothetical protein
LHALLHIADDIEAIGPVWCYWAFPMERFCGALARANKSRRYPYSSLNRRVLQLAQLSQIKHSYGLAEELDLEERRQNIVSGVQYGGYSDLRFVTPKRERSIQRPLIHKVARAICKRIGVNETLVRDALEDRPFVAWGKMQRIVHNAAGDVVGGDLIRGAHISSSNHETRDATHVQVSCRPHAPLCPILIHPLPTRSITPRNHTGAGLAPRLTSMRRPLALAAPSSLL